MTALAESFSQGQRVQLPNVISGRYGLSSKEFDPDCVITIFHQLKQAKPKTRFTIGINDNVTGLSLQILKASLPITHKLTALFYDLGSDGTVSATKNTIKLIGNHTPSIPRDISFMTPKRQGG